MVLLLKTVVNKDIITKLPESCVQCGNITEFGWQNSGKYLFNPFHLSGNFVCIIHDNIGLGRHLLSQNLYRYHRCHP